MTASDDGARPAGVQSVDRAIALLELLARRGEAGAAELAAEIDVHRSTTFRLLASLEAGGLVEQTAERGRYRLGFGLVALAGTVAGQMDVSRVGRSVLTALAAELGETINLAVLQEHFAVNVDQALGPAAITTVNWVGRLTPLHCTSSGKVLLASRPTAERLDLIERAAPERFTEATLVGDALLAELDAVAEDGHAIAVEEYEVGLTAAAAPVRDRRGRVVAALSVSGPAYRLDRAALAASLDALHEGADEISRRLGHLG